MQTAPFLFGKSWCAVKGADANFLTSRLSKMPSVTGAQQRAGLHDWNFRNPAPLPIVTNMEADMGFGRGALLWLLGIPLPIILILALFWHH